MKRYVIVFCVLLLSVCTFSQIQVKKQGQIIKIETLSATGLGNAYNLCYSTFSNQYIIQLTTTNQFDDNILVKLGADEDTAIESLKALIGIIDEGGKDSYDIGDDISVKVANSKSLKVYQSGKAGWCFLSKKNLEKCVDYMNAVKIGDKESVR